MMKYFLILLLFVTYTDGLFYEKTNERLFNGTEAPLNAFPWMVSVRFNIFNTLITDCGGAILSDIFLLTAASCFQGFILLPQYTSIKAGIHNLINGNQTTEQKRIISHIIVHPNYSSHSFVNDLALVRITPPFDFNSSSVSSISLSNLTSVENMDLITIGWGNASISAGNLQQITIRENIQCTKNIAINSTTQICATGTCSGDGGGPLMVYSNNIQQYELVGITNFRNVCTTEGLFTRIKPFASWIWEILDDPPVTPPIQTLPTIPTTTTTPEILGPPIPFICNTNYSCGCSPTPVIFHDEPPVPTNSRYNEGRIVGGETAQPHSWSWVVNIRFFNTPVCGGTLINEEWVLTAAHCTIPVEGLTVHIGNHDIELPSLQIRRVVQQILHPDYVPPPQHINDIALLRLSSPVNFTTPDHHAGITCLPSQSSDMNFPKADTRLAVIGWGRLFHGGPAATKLRQVRVKTLANDDWRCINATYDKQRQFCAMVDGGGKDSCQGDSGGPIHQWLDDHWEQVGIVSYGRGCALANHPGIYTRLSFYYDWIQETMTTATLPPTIIVETTTTMTIEETTNTTIMSNMAPICNSSIFYTVIFLYIISFLLN